MECFVCFFRVFADDELACLESINNHLVECNRLARLTRPIRLGRGNQVEAMHGREIKQSIRTKAIKAGQDNQGKSR